MEAGPLRRMPCLFGCSSLSSTSSGTHSSFSSMICPLLFLTLEVCISLPCCPKIGACCPSGNTVFQIVARTICCSLLPLVCGRQDQDLCHTLYIENDSSSLPAVLWALVIVLIGVFVKVEPLAGYLQLPYLAWVTFASVLNYTLLKLNTQPVSSPFICCVHDLMTSATCLLANMACSPHISSL